ncbi:hypothetical protein JCM18920_3230 [Cutibacterium acnes JCM 18920]|nr:hypothetical protein JCM18920_3230 [Cutibacterium acnes JCM 18920]
MVEGRHLAATLLDGLRQVRVFRAHVGTARGPGIVTVVTGSEGRGWKYFGNGLPPLSVKDWPMRVEPTTLPLTVSCEPLAW